MKRSSTVSNQDRMKSMGLDERDGGDSAQKFHDLDEIMASPLAEWKRPWWVRTVDEPTLEVDWDGMERFDARKIQQVSWRKYVGEEKARELNQRREEKMLQWILDNKPGYTLRDRALDISGSQAGSVGTSFLGSWDVTASMTKDEGKVFDILIPLNIVKME